MQFIQVLANLATYIHDGYYETALSLIPEVTQRTGLWCYPDLPGFDQLHPLLCDLEEAAQRYGNDGINDETEVFRFYTLPLLFGLQSMLLDYEADPITFSAVNSLRQSESLAEVFAEGVINIHTPSDWFQTYSSPCFFLSVPHFLLFRSSEDAITAIFLSLTDAAAWAAQHPTQVASRISLSELLEVLRALEQTEG